MPRYDHLPLRRLEGELDRRKRLGGRPPVRDAKVHGAVIQSEIEDVIQSQKQRPRIADINPALILKVRTASPIDKDDWARVGMKIVASDPEKTFILFADDAELQEFKRRVEAYQKDPPAGNKHPQYTGFVSAIEEVGLIEPADRIGPVLQAEGYLDPAQFGDDENEVLDIELWQPGAANVAVSIYRVERRLQELGGTLISEYQGNSAVLMRVEGGGAVIRGLLELPEILSIDRPPRPDLPDVDDSRLAVAEIPFSEPPQEDAIVIGVVDSGLNTAHPLLESVVLAGFGVPDNLGDDDEKGHGTSVSGICVYGDVRKCLDENKFSARFHLASAKVVNREGKFDDRQIVAQQMEIAIRRLHDEFGCRVINISLCDTMRPVKDKPSAWAAVLDDLARELDLVIVVSAGNVEGLLAKHGDGVVKAYPKYLLDDEHRILEPGSAVNILTVGSLAHGNGLSEEDGDVVGVRPLTEAGQPSPFTRIGPGIAEIIKPDFVDYGGTAIFDGPTQALMEGQQRPAAGVLSLHHLYLERLFTSRSGTSFAAPLVAYKAALVRDAFPTASANLVRALLALSAEYPEAAIACLDGFNDDDRMNILGYGMPDVDRALSSEDNRVILYREDALAIDRFAVYEVPIPTLFQTEKGLKRIRVALTFDPPVRHTRIDYMGISMSFRLFRGANEKEVFDACRKWSKVEGKRFDLPGNKKCDMLPGPTKREHGTLQCATFEAKRTIKQYGDKYFLAVRCEGEWAKDLVEQQRFAVAVELRHQAEIALYQRVQERVKLRA